MKDAANLQLGDHVCLPFDNDEASRAHIVAFTHSGIDARQRVLLFTQTVTVDMLAGWLRQHNRSFVGAMECGQLQVHSPQDVHLAGGHFDPNRMMAGFAQAIDLAEADGYRGLRVHVDMTWALESVPGVEQLFGFEAAANRLFVDQRLAAVCAYDRRRFDRTAIQRACAAHPITPDMSMLRFTRSGDAGLALRGEVDFVNRNALDGLLACLPDADVTLDLTGLTFLDAAGMGLLARTAATRTHRTTLLCNPATARRLRLFNVDSVATISSGE
jgi:anti-anti-sigma regulatory factor